MNSSVVDSSVMNSSVMAGIVTHNPDPDRLTENIQAIAPQVDEVVIFDNGSHNLGALDQVTGGFPAVHVLHSHANRGIAHALNQIADYAAKAGEQWLVTLDQDSVAAGGMVTQLYEQAKHGVSMAAPFIVDRNKMTVDDFDNANLPRIQPFTQAARRGAITSGALVNLAALKEVGGFDETFFIDYVDYDFNQRLLLAGHTIVRVNSTYLLHEVGKAQKTWLLVPRRTIDGKWTFERFYSFGHSVERCYYKARNRVLFTRKYWKHIGLTHEGAIQIPTQIALTVLFEDHKGEKLKAFCRGAWDGMRMPLEFRETRPRE